MSQSVCHIRKTKSLLHAKTTPPQTGNTAIVFLTPFTEGGARRGEKAKRKSVEECGLNNFSNAIKDRYPENSVMKFAMCVLLLNDTATQTRLQYLLLNTLPTTSNSYDMCLKAFFTNKNID